MQFEVIDLGLTDFKTACDFQKETFLAVKNRGAASALILCQHYPVITLGRRANKNNILTDERELGLKGICICQAERGGDITYHGPGQLTAYPIFDLSTLKKDINYFLRFLEKTVIKMLSDFGVKADNYPGLTGVWVGKQKIASIGIAVRNWITFHGLSINIKENDLENFNLIKPCGMNIRMTSLESTLRKAVGIEEAKDKLINSLRDTLSIG